MLAAALSSSTAPSTEYRQHHQVEAPRVDASEFRPGWRVETGLDPVARRRARSQLGRRQEYDFGSSQHRIGPTIGLPPWASENPSPSCIPQTPYPIIPITGSHRIWRNRPRHILHRSLQSRVRGLRRYQIHYFTIITARTSQTLPAVSVSYASNDSSSRSHICICATPHSRVIFTWYLGHERLFRDFPVTNYLSVTCISVIFHRHNHHWRG